MTPAGLVKVDAIYGLDYETLRATPEAWPATYQNPSYPNIFAIVLNLKILKVVDHSKRA